MILLANAKDITQIENDLEGIKNHVLPSTVPFGKIAMDLNKLFYQNILSIKRHNGNKILDIEIKEFLIILLM
jgi:hypothetical protein